MRYVQITLTTFSLLGCSSTPPAQQSTPLPACQSTTESGASLAEEAEDADGDDDVTFYRDLLPVLSSNTRGASYKCTTCHAHYAKPEGLNSVTEVEHVIKSMQTGRMPRAGSAVPSEKIELFVKWRLQGFKSGDPSDTPKTSPLDAKSVTPNSGCTP